MQVRDASESSVLPNSLRTYLRVLFTFSFEKNVLPFSVCINSMKMQLIGQPISSLWLKGSPNFTAESIISIIYSPECPSNVIGDWLMPCSQFILKIGSEYMTFLNASTEGSKSLWMELFSLTFFSFGMHCRILSMLTLERPPSLWR